MKMKIGLRTFEGQRENSPEKLLVSEVAVQYLLKGAHGWLTWVV